MWYEDKPEGMQKWLVPGDSRWKVPTIRHLGESHGVPKSHTLTQAGLGLACQTILEVCHLLLILASVNLGSGDCCGTKVRKKLCESGWYLWDSR